jgi:hypothetical protein
MSERQEPPVEHYVWEGFYIPAQWDDPTGHVLATTKDRAMELIAEEADVPDAGWEQHSRDENLYQLHRTTHHVVTVKRRPVYGDPDE